MSKWKVHAGKISANFATIEEAKRFARRFEFAQIIDSLGFVRFISNRYRISKV